MPKYKIAILAYFKGLRIYYKLNQLFTFIIYKRISCGKPLKINGKLTLILFNIGDIIIAFKPIRSKYKLIILN